LRHNLCHGTAEFALDIVNFRFAESMTVKIDFLILGVKNHDFWSVSVLDDLNLVNTVLHPLGANLAQNWNGPVYHLQSVRPESAIGLTIEHSLH
jgi:hypothetical protein